jgi:hypothetical protein
MYLWQLKALLCWGDISRSGSASTWLLRENLATASSVRSGCWQLSFIGSQRSQEALWTLFLDWVLPDAQKWPKRGLLAFERYTAALLS